MDKQLTYQDAGVDQSHKDGLIDRVIQMMRRTYDPRVLDQPWGFAGFFSLNYPKGPIFSKHYKTPILVSCTDGVGTKLKIAIMTDKHDTVGIDLVAMSINDLIVSGAEPLFFLDYIALGKVEGKILLDLVKGIVAGCQQAGCALLGGETAEMPGFYQPNEYEMAGFAVGIVEKNRIITGRLIKPNDCVIGLASSGLHSNGYSLVRKVFFEQHKIKPDKYIDELGRTLVEELLEPTRIYAKSIREIIARYRVKRAVKGVINITGGGLVENIPRILPPKTDVEIRKDSWKIHPIFNLIQKSGNINQSEMYRVFNMGIGMVLISDPFYANAIMHRLSQSGETPYLIGRVTRGNQEVKII